MDAKALETILKSHPKDPGSIIQVMLDVQNDLYYERNPRITPSSGK